MTDNEYDKAYRDPDVLTELYHEQGLSISEVAEKLNCCYKTIYNWMEEYNIEKEKPTHSNDYPTHFRTTEMGYEAWQPNLSGAVRTVLVHRLVCVAEYGVDAVDGMDVHHKNEIPWDNRSENLALMTPSEHRKHHHGSDQTSSSPPTDNGQTTITAYTND